MSSPDQINAVIDAVIARINANLSPLGLDRVTERDEQPAYLTPPEAYAIPFVEGRDTIKLFADGEEHTYPLNIVGFYKYQGTSGMTDGLRPTRTYGLTALDLFTRTNATVRTTSPLGIICGGEIKDDASVEVGYWRNADFAMHFWLLKMTFNQVVT